MSPSSSPLASQSATTTFNNNNNKKKAPTRFVIRSLEQRKTRSFLQTIIPILIVIGLLYYYDSNITNELIWILGGLLCGIWLLETSPYKREIILTLSIGPLGIQRSITRNGEIKHQPFIPREIIQDCILLEHIEVFSVSTHIIFRLKQQKRKHDQQQHLIPILAFPNATMKFDQCQSLLKQIRQALQET